jgi:hypothetical protein
MYEVTINHKAGKRVYPVYTREEAKKEGIKYVYWKHAQEGDYGCSDDGRVSECYSRKTPPKGKVSSSGYDYLRFGMGTTWVNSPEFYVKGRLSVHTSSGEHSFTRDMRTKKAKKLIDLVARNTPVAEAIQRVIGPSKKADWDKWFRITRSREFKKNVDADREAILQDAGITDDALAEAWIELKRDAEALGDKKEQLRLRRGILQDLSGFKGWGKEDKVRLKHEQIEGVFDSKMLGEIMQIKGASKEAEGTVEQLTQSTKSDES